MMNPSNKKDMEQFFYGLSILVIALSGIVWLAGMSSTSSSNAADIHDLKVREAEHSKEFEEIRTRLTHIEDAVGVNR